ncbi:hypothetical protein AB0M32_16395 [Streptomyces sp. NPDC051985]|uniref:hypothetical protein n=1 Tax=Streptomyces sp. NPDC051985 TaxID=3155807 RepID=UPI0034344D51
MPAHENAVALRFVDPATAHQAFDDLRHLDPAITDIRGAALIERLAEGGIRVAEGMATDPGRDTTSSGLVGSLIGILGGPLGTLLGWGIGAMISGGHDSRPVYGTAGAIETATPHLPPGGKVILAEVAESDTEPLDLLAMRYDAVLERSSARSVRAELDAMQEEDDRISRMPPGSGRHRKPTHTQHVVAA